MKALRKLHPAKIDQELAQPLLDQFLLLIHRSDPKLFLNLEGKHFKVNENILGVFVAVLDKISKGEDVSLVAKKMEYTTQEAANILHVSRPFLTKLLEQGAIPFRWVGTHRRIDAGDLKAYKKKMDQEKKEAFEELARLGQELEHG